MSIKPSLLLPGNVNNTFSIAVSANALERKCEWKTQAKVNEANAQLVARPAKNRSNHCVAEYVMYRTSIFCIILTCLKDIFRFIIGGSIVILPLKLERVVGNIVLVIWCVCVCVCVSRRCTMLLNLSLHR